MIYMFVRTSRSISTILNDENGFAIQASGLYFWPLILVRESFCGKRDAVGSFIDG